MDVPVDAEAQSEGAAPGGSGRLRRVVALAGTVRTVAGRPRVRPWLFTITALVFLALAVASFRALPDEGRAARPALVAVLVLVTAPATLALNALEYRFMATRLGYRIGFAHALRVSLVASIANYLPAPGGVAVRTAALKRQGSTVRSAVSINVVAGLVWLGATGLVAGGVMLSNDRLAGRATAAAALGAGAVLVAALWLRRGGGHWRGPFRQVLLIELAMVVVSGTRVWLSLAAIGQPAGLGASIAISSSTVFAALLGIFPAGLGLREVLAGGIATAVGVPAAAAVAASAVDRVASQVGMAGTALVAGVRRRDLTAGGGAAGSGDAPDDAPRR